MSDTAPSCGKNKHDCGEANQYVCDACLIEDAQEKEKQREAYILLTERAGKLDHRMLARRNDALRLVLMFNKGGIWSAENVAEWRRITGSDEATTKVLCDHIRKLLDIGDQYLKGMG